MFLAEYFSRFMLYNYMELLQIIECFGKSQIIASFYLLVELSGKFHVLFQGRLVLVLIISGQLLILISVVSVLEI